MSALNENRKEEICAALEKATGLPWQPFLPVTSEDIPSYESPILPRGVVVDYKKASRIVAAFEEAGLLKPRRSRVSVTGLDLKDGNPNAHLAGSLILRSDLVGDPEFRQHVKRNAGIQRAFDVVREAPVYPAVAKANRDFSRGEPLGNFAVKVRQAMEAGPG